MDCCRRLVISALGLAFAAGVAQGAEGEVKRFSQVIDSRQAEYVIEVGGTIDPQNVEITIENLGDQAVVDPRLTVNGLYDWFDLESMVAEITRGCATDEEKALAIWEWIHWKRFQRSPADHSALHPVRAMNGYGYGICGHSAAWLKALCTTAGLPARVQEIWGHTVNEVYYDGAWHFLDSNVKVFYLGADNHHLASLAELEQDGALIERTIHPRDPWERPEQDPDGRNEEFVRYIVSSRDNFVDDGYDREIARDYDMSYTLRPGEKLTRWWEPRLGKFEGRAERAEVPQRYANGQLVWEPDLKKVDLEPFVKIVDNVTTRFHGMESGPAIQVKELQDRDFTRPSRFALPVASAYPIMGGNLICELRKDPGASVGVFFGEPGWENADLYSYRWGSGTERVELYLDQKLQGLEPCYGYEIGFMLSGSAGRKTPAQAGVESFRLVTDLQVSPHSLPALALGKNVIHYRDSSPSGAKVRITHQWVEHSGNHPPAAVAAAVSPSAGETVKSLAPVLEWQPAADADAGDKAADYQVMVSARPDCRWPLAMSLYRNLGSESCRWQVAKSFLNPGTTYYWKVRARDTGGAVGPWSRVFSFTTDKNAKPAGR